MAVDFFVIDNRSAHALRYVFGQQVAMEAKELFFYALPCLPIVKERMRWLILGGEDQGDIVIGASPDRQVNLRRREIFDARHLKGSSRACNSIEIDISKPRARKFVGRGPSRQNTGARILRGQEAFRVHMQNDEVAISLLDLSHDVMRNGTGQVGQPDFGPLY